ncbi:MAG: hypothetical protein PHT07_10765 [Paludibacter sp.]|nr:hypothetical protein [Paludibacter sp.]
MSSASNSKSIVYHEVKTSHNAETGELTEQTNRRVYKVPRTPDFIMLFTKHISFLEQLNKGETAVLSAILESYVGIGNMVFLSPQSRKQIGADLGVVMSSIHKAIKALLEKKILIEGENKFIYLNPHLFGKGNWEDISKLRQIMTVDFDFQKQEAIVSREVKTTYIGDVELSKPHEVIDAKEYTDGDGVHQEVVIQESSIQDADIVHAADSLPMQEQNLDKQITMLKEQNRQLELKLELAKITAGQN